MNELPKEYAMVHIYTPTKAREPIVIKGNTEGLCVLVNALISAIAFNDGTAEIFDGDAELHEVVVRLVNTKEELGNVKRALKTAEAIAPCVLFIDEVEKALSGIGDTSGVSQRILGTLLTFMAECTAGVFIVATCNDPSALPSEFKRKGRFDESFFVDLPTEPERVQILAIHLQRFGIHLESEYLESIVAPGAP